MRKRIFSIITCLILTGSVLFTVKADVLFLYGNILQKALVSEGLGDQQLMLKMADVNGAEAVYTCDQNTLVNGQTYKRAEELDAVVPENAFVKMAVEENIIKVLNFSTEVREYTNAQFNTKRKTFNGLTSKHSNLPVYYRYNEGFVPSYTDENHYYDIEVYEYAVCIKDMRSKNDNEVIKYIETGSGINSDFKQYISVYCESTLSGNGMLNAELYDNKNNLVGEAESSCSNVGEVIFDRLENQSKEYTLKLWLEDEYGSKISNHYIKKTCTEKIDTQYAYILQKGISGNFEETLQIKTTDSTGQETIYNCAEKILINGMNYRSASEAEAALQNDVYAVIMVENDLVTMVNFGTGFEFYQNETYNADTNTFDCLTAEQAKLPVYYSYNDGFAPLYADENHYYDIEVYEYAVCIKDMRSNSDTEVIKYIEASSGINSDFQQFIGVYCESTLSGNGILKAELYDPKNNLIDKAESSCTDIGEVVFDQLENYSKAYSVKLWIEDEEGNRISSIYTQNILMDEIEISYAHIMQKGISEGIEEILQLKTADSTGRETIYNCAQSIYINGMRYRTAAEAEAEIQDNVFAKIAVKNNVVTMISFSTGCDIYQNESYNDSTNSFDCLTAEQKKLPVYYRYNDGFAQAYTDGHHYYDIEVYEHAVCITDMRSKSDAEVIKYIEINDGIDRNFMQYIEVYSESTPAGSYVLKGELCDDRLKPVCKAESMDGNPGTIEFTGLKNHTGNYVIKLWLEDDNKKAISSTYIINKQINQMDISYGDVVIKYHKKTGENEQLFLNVKDISGRDRVLLCDENTRIINGATLFSLDEISTEIPENSFAKMAIENDTLKLIRFGLDTLDISSQDFKFADNQLDGSVYVVNNTANQLSLTLVCAAYDSLDQMKGIKLFTLSIDAEDYTVAQPVFDNYQYAQGDYVKIFALNAGDKITPLLESVHADITAE